MEGLIIIIISFIFSIITNQKKSAPNNQTAKIQFSKKTLPSQLMDRFLSLKPEQPIDKNEVAEADYIIKEPIYEIAPKAGQEEQLNPNMISKSESIFNLEQAIEKAPLFKNKEALRKAIVMSEILGKPKSINR